MADEQAELFPSAVNGTAPIAVTDLGQLHDLAEGCRACDLYERATQVVFGEGPAGAQLVFIGEQPGDKEDLAGRPFVGPAGEVLDRALEAAGIDRAVTYVTNAVKHFKWKPHGKVRLHQKPNAREVAACRQWWEAEVAAIRPAIVCCLGATAAQAVFGADYRVTREHGRFRQLPDGTWATATVHPSAILRSRDREALFAGLVADLELVAGRLDGAAAGSASE